MQYNVVCPAWHCYNHKDTIYPPPIHFPTPLFLLMSPNHGGNATRCMQSECKLSCGSRSLCVYVSMLLSVSWCGNCRLHESDSKILFIDYNRAFYYFVNVAHYYHIQKVFARLALCGASHHYFFCSFGMHATLENVAFRCKNRIKRARYEEIWKWECHWRAGRSIDALCAHCYGQCQYVDWERTTNNSSYK